MLAKKYASGNLLTRWAAGGGVQGGKNTEQIEEEERLETVGMWRDGVVWFLGRGVEGLGESWRGMVERRVGRERERGRSVLYAMKNGQQDGESVGGGEGGWREGPGAGWGGERMGAKDVAMEEEARREMEMLSPEQLQLFAKENQDMLKRYEDTLDQVRYVLVALDVHLHFFVLLAKLISACHTAPQNARCWKSPSSSPHLFRIWIFKAPTYRS